MSSHSCGVKAACVVIWLLCHGLSVAALVEPVVERIDRRAPGARDFVLRFWDGSEVAPPAGVDAALILVVRRPEALSYTLRQPNELGLGRAWVTGALDVEGDLERGLALRERFRGLRLSAGDRLPRERGAGRRGAGAPGAGRGVPRYGWAGGRCGVPPSRRARRGSPAAAAIRSCATARPSATTT